MKNKPLFPLFVDLSEKKAVVVGAGEVAARRVQTLLPFIGEILVVAPEAKDVIVKLAEEGKIVYEKRTFDREDVYDADLVLAATDDLALNDEIYSVCKCLGIMVNVATNQQKCDFQFPSVIQEDHIVIGINASGNDHVGVKEMRQKIEGYLKHE